MRLTDSWRTPLLLRADLAKRWPVEYQPWEQCLPGWLANELALAENAWVTEDSVSMIYEALTAGCAVGLVLLEAMIRGRFARGVEMLEGKNQVVRLSPIKGGAPFSEELGSLSESQRIAEVLITRL